MFEWFKRKTLEECRESVKAHVRREQITAPNASLTYAFQALELYPSRDEVAASFMREYFDEKARVLVG